MNIKITADSTCDLSEELLRQWNISLMPMHILMGEDTYLDGVTIHPADVFAHVDAGGQTPKSAAANPVEYIDFFEPFAKEYDAVIHISVSAKLSSCYQNACLAAQEYANVSVIDSDSHCLLLLAFPTMCVTDQAHYPPRQSEQSHAPVCICY